MSEAPVWRRETITPKTEDVFRALAGVLPPKTYLAGGTALALSFGHRRSLDLDFFVPEAFSEEQLLQELRHLPDVSAVERSPQTLHLTVREVKVSFLGYQYPILFPMERFFEVPIADPRDIACMKLTAIASRGTKRDFIDFYASCRRYGIRDLLPLFGRKYARTGYNVVRLVKSLTYFEDAEKGPMPHMWRLSIGPT